MRQDEHVAGQQFLLVDVIVHPPEQPVPPIVARVGEEFLRGVDRRVPVHRGRIALGGELGARLELIEAGFDRAMIRVDPLLDPRFPEIPEPHLPARPLRRATAPDHREMVEHADMDAADLAVHLLQRIRFGIQEDPAPQQIEAAQTPHRLGEGRCAAGPAIHGRVVAEQEMMARRLAGRQRDEIVHQGGEEVDRHRMEKDRVGAGEPGLLGEQEKIDAVLIEQRARAAPGIGGQPFVSLRVVQGLREDVLNPAMAGIALAAQDLRVHAGRPGRPLDRLGCRQMMPGIVPQARIGDEQTLDQIATGHRRSPSPRCRGCAPGGALLRGHRSCCVRHVPRAVWWAAWRAARRPAHPASVPSWRGNRTNRMVDEPVPRGIGRFGRGQILERAGDTDGGECQRQHP